MQSEEEDYTFVVKDLLHLKEVQYRELMVVKKKWEKISFLIEINYQNQYI